MKCPKCNYTSFDYSRSCPKCGNDNSEEQARLAFSPNKPDPPFFLASLLGTEDSEVSGMPAQNAPRDAGGNTFGDMDPEDLLIALDDMDAADPEEPSLASVEEEEAEILFELDPEEDDQRDSDDQFFRDNKVSDGAPAAEPGRRSANDAAAVPERKDMEPATEAEISLFSEDDAERTAISDGAPVFPVNEPSKTKETDDDDTLFSLDGILESDAEPEPIASGQGKTDEILFELEEESKPDHQTRGKDLSDEIVFELEETTAGAGNDEKKGFWDSDDIKKETALSDLEETEGSKIDTAAGKTPDTLKESNPFSDLDIEPLDLELSLDDLEKKSE